VGTTNALLIWWTRGPDILCSAGGVSAVAGDFGFFGAGFFAELAAIFFAGGRDTDAGNVSALGIFLVGHGDSFQF
jgi:hypothetical protein